MKKEKALQANVKLNSLQRKAQPKDKELSNIKLEVAKLTYSTDREINKFKDKFGRPPTLGQWC
ncbi:hypothetical protein SLS61_000899 [Didymella pomorum]